MLHQINTTMQNVDQIIQQLKDMEVDGETMQHILEQVGMDDQMHRQLVMSKPIESTKELLEELSNLKQLQPTDFVIYDRANDNPLQDSYGRVILFGVKDEALDDCRGNEEVLSCTDLPKHWQDTILTQINLED